MTTESQPERKRGFIENFVRFEATVVGLWLGFVSLAQFQLAQAALGLGIAYAASR